MIDSVQHKSGGGAILGVLQQHIDGVLHLVGHPLSRWLSLRPQFEVFDRVVIAVSVSVMDLFKRCQRSSKCLLHNVAVKQDFFAAPQVKHAVTTVETKVSLVRNRTPLATFVPAVLRAKSLFAIIARFYSGLRAKFASFSDFSAELALEHEYRLVAHVGQCTA